MTSVFAVGCVGAPAGEATTEQATTVCGAGPTAKGVDVSYYQGNVDWNAAAGDGVQFAFVRVSDGTGFEDPKFAANWSGTRDAGILRGAYQFFEPGEDPIAQADLLLAKMGTLEANDLPPVIDVEATGGLGPAGVATAVGKWLDHVQAAIGRAPIIYTGFYFWRDSVGAPDYTTSPLWHAQYTSAECPNIAPPWSDWAFWQYTSSGSVAGISGNVDTNRFNGTIDQLMQLTAQPAPCGVIDATGGVIDDGTPCFHAGGPAAGLRHVASAGEGGSLVWTHTTAETFEQNFAQWNLNFAAAGRYKLEVATSAAFAQSKLAVYTVHVNGADTAVTIDQTAVDGFQSLGEFDVAGGGDQFVHIGDNTGEAEADNVQLVFDELRITPVAPGDGGDGSGSGSDGSGSDGNDDGGKHGGGCDAGAGGAGLLAIALLGLVRRRRS